MLEIIVITLLLSLLLGVLWVGQRISRLARNLDQFPATVAEQLETKHRSMLADLHEG